VSRRSPYSFSLQFSRFRTKLAREIELFLALPARVLPSDSPSVPAPAKLIAHSYRTLQGQLRHGMRSFYGERVSVTWMNRRELVDAGGSADWAQPASPRLG